MVPSGTLLLWRGCPMMWCMAYCPAKKTSCGVALTVVWSNWQLPETVQLKKSSPIPPQMACNTMSLIPKHIFVPKWRTAVWRGERVKSLFSEEILPDTLQPFVYLAGLRINQQPAIFGKAESVLDQPIPYTNQLRLQYYQNNLTFEFAALDFTAPGKNSYRYRLVVRLRMGRNGQ